MWVKSIQNCRSGIENTFRKENVLITRVYVRDVLTVDAFRSETMDRETQRVSKVRYSTNWMGVAHMKWYTDRNLTVKKTVTVRENSLLVKHGKHKPGDTYEVDEPIQYYSVGRIDFYNNIEGMRDEMSLPLMKNEDWGRFSNWLETVETDFPWTLEQLVELYERTNPKIEWWKED